MAVTLVALAGVALIPVNDATQVPGWPAPAAEPGISNAATSLERWDALWFLRIAEDGYDDDDASAAFFPLYPLLTRAVGWLVGGHPLAGALIVSNLAAFLALLVVYRLTRLEYDDATARTAVLLIAVFPTSFFLLAPYSESLFLLLAAGSVLAARRRSWVAAGALGALAAATRSIGIVLVPVLLVEAMHQQRERRQRSPADEAEEPGHPIASFAGALMPALGMAAYLAYWQAASGDALRPFSEQASWLREFSFPVLTLLDGTRSAFEFVGIGVGGYALLDWFVVVPVVTAAIWALFRARPVHGVYAALSLLIPLTFVFDARPFMSLPRFALTIWPAFWGFARFIQGRRVPQLYAAGSALGLGVFLLLYVNWYWIF